MAWSWQPVPALPLQPQMVTGGIHRALHKEGGFCHLRNKNVQWEHVGSETTAVKVVTDSIADLPYEVVKALDITVVPIRMAKISSTDLTCPPKDGASIIA
jgi:hypothetical protein